MNEEQHVIGHQAAPREQFHSEEAGASQHVRLSGNEIPPGGVLASLGSRIDPMAPQDVSHGLVGQSVTQMGQGSNDAVISPAGVLTSHSHRQSFRFRRNRRAANLLPVFGSIEFFSDEPPVPS